MPGEHAPILSRHALRCLGRAVARWPAASGRGLDAHLRERVILHVSAVNACRVCAMVHELTGRRVGLTDDEIAAARARRIDGVDPRLDAALRYATLRTLDREHDHPDEVAELARWFSPAERVALTATVDLFTFTNAFNNTWERLLPRPIARRIRRSLRTGP